MKKLFSGINNPDAEHTTQSVKVCCSHKAVAAGFIPFVTTQSVAEERRVLNPPHE